LIGASGFFRIVLVRYRFQRVATLAGSQETRVHAAAAGNDLLTLILLRDIYPMKVFSTRRNGQALLAEERGVSWLGMLRRMDAELRFAEKMSTFVSVKNTIVSKCYAEFMYTFVYLPEKGECSKINDLDEKMYTFARYTTLAV
jgi:hypothetical protein